jgi:hypothetical protein
MASNRKHIFAGMLWALTDFGRGEILRMVESGMKLDLAYAVLDEQVKTGVYEERDVYQLPPAKEHNVK